LEIHSIGSKFINFSGVSIGIFDRIREIVSKVRKRLLGRLGQEIGVLVIVTASLEEKKRGMSDIDREGGKIGKSNIVDSIHSFTEISIKDKISNNCSNKEKSANK
jgi:hypothetical protein